MSKKILVVDDEEAHRLWSFEILKQNGYEVDTCSNARKALRLTDETDYDLIISDLVMPEMSGTDFIKEVYKNRKDQKAIILTGHGDVETFIESVYDLGVCEYIVKPVETEEFISMVGKLISESDEDVELTA